MCVSRLKKAILLFVVSYILLYAFYLAFPFLPAWEGYSAAFFSGTPSTGYLFIDPLFLFIPLIGFALVWLGSSWLVRTFEDARVYSIPFALGYVIASYLAFFVALVGFYWNNAFLVSLSRGENNPGIVSISPTLNFVMQNYMDLLLKSPYFLFVLAGLLGWISFVIVSRYWVDKKE